MTEREWSLIAVDRGTYVYRSSLAPFELLARVKIECPCGESVEVPASSGGSASCPSCGRHYTLTLEVLRTDAAALHANPSS